MVIISFNLPLIIAFVLKSRIQIGIEINFFFFYIVEKV